LRPRRSDAAAARHQQQREQSGEAVPSVLPARGGGTRTARACALQSWAPDCARLPMRWRVPAAEPVHVLRVRATAGQCHAAGAGRQHAAAHSRRRRRHVRQQQRGGARACAPGEAQHAARNVAHAA
jgi:hypothetical protein